MPIGYNRLDEDDSIGAPPIDITDLSRASWRFLGAPSEVTVESLKAGRDAGKANSARQATPDGAETIVVSANA
ncbi:MAG: hypothetical protein JW709_05585 [Sedimentisphaerales bacterium]|nr:hypothetical protein [Sedimentisphaerales bacterium]